MSSGEVAELIQPVLTPEQMQAGRLAIEAIMSALNGFTDDEALHAEIFESDLQGEFVAALIGIAGGSLALLAHCEGKPLAEIMAAAGACYAQPLP